MQLTSRAKAVLLLNAATFLWATNVLLGRAMRGQVGPWTITGTRCLVASLCFLALWLFRSEGSQPAPTRREWLLLALMGLSGALGFQVLQYAGLKLTTAANAGIVNATNPVVTMLLARAFLGVPIGLVAALGAFLSLCGVALLVLGSGAGVSGGVNPGDMLVLSAVTLWGVYTIAGKALLDKRDSVWVASISTWLATPVALMPAAFECAKTPPAPTPSLLLGLAYIGIGPAFAAFLAWNEGVRRIGPNAATVFINTMALYATILSALVINEPPTIGALAGGALIVTGCLVALWRR